MISVKVLLRMDGRVEEKIDASELNALSWVSSMTVVSAAANSERSKKTP